MLNNARLAAVADYHGLVPPLERLLERHGRDLPAFYREIEKLGEMEPEERRMRLESGHSGE